jgi:SAM-dependent methyltransferase
MSDEFQHRMYDDLVWTWPLISDPSLAVEEVKLFSKLVKERAERPIKTLLHMGCGGGHMDFTFKEEFQLTGLDLSEGMLDHARALNPEVEYLIGDMRDARLGRTFDAVVVLDSISYMVSQKELNAAFRTAWEHLEPGGVFLTYAEQVKETFEQNKTIARTGVDGETSLTLIENDYDPDPEDTTTEYTLVYIIRKDGKFSVETEQHLMGLFPLKVWSRILRSIGFEVKRRKYNYTNEWVDLEYQLFICLKPDTSD